MPVIQHVVSLENGKVESRFDDQDPRIDQPCPKCQWDGKVVNSFVMKDWTGEGKHREMHQMKCLRCKHLICALPHALTRADAAAFEMPFGKHKGKKLADVPADYLSWLTEQPKMSKISRLVRVMRGE